ncbi:hypothetical protein O6P37_10025 [Mycobacterium sp. CPCC 205372]|uniref:DUF8017 domain-containing protein n=1 Tax=Mycobacterium hippophais TaxID=3016340 RepID=A0ABT4PRK0_9MYCO|nr:hypothetical protein [Mycobacterium hippophais]MCZ8379199.1 hypothetical protein [Mycobacterium hippophais]
MDPVHDYPANQPGQNRPTPWLWIALTIAVVIIVVLAAIVISQNRDNTLGSAKTAAPSSARESATPSSTQSPSARTAKAMTCEGYTAQVDPGSQPGWQPTVGKRGLAYAVPPEWAVGGCGVQIGWQAACPAGQQGVCAARAMGSVATLRDPACLDGNLAMAGVAGSQNPDIRVALDNEIKTVPTIYAGISGSKPKVDFGPVREFTIGTHPAVQMVAKVTDIRTPGCTGPEALHSMVVTTVPNVEGSVVFLISLRQGAPGAPNRELIDDMVRTLRSPA